MNFFSWLGSDKRHEIPKPRPVIAQKDRNSIIEKDNVSRVTM